MCACACCHCLLPHHVAWHHALALHPRLWYPLHLPVTEGPQPSASPADNLPLSPPQVLALKLTQENYIRALAGVLMDEGSRAQPNTQLNAALGAPRVRRSISEGAGQLGATQDGVYVTSY